VTGLNPENFVERAFEFHLSAAQALAAHHSNGNGNGAQAKARATKNREAVQTHSAATANA
jgi:hypothetical protein